MRYALLHRWSLFVLRHSRTMVWPFSCLALTSLLAILQFTTYAHFHFLLIAALLTLWAFERVGFVQVVAAKDAEIARLAQEHAQTLSER